MPTFLSLVKLGIHALPALDARTAGAQRKPDGPQRPSLSGNLEHWLATILGDVLGGWELSSSGMQRWNTVFLRDGRLIASGSDDCTIRVWDMRTSSLVAGLFQGHTHWVLLVLFSPNSKRIVSGSQDKTVCIWSAVNGTLPCGPLHGHIGLVHSVTYLPDGTLIASASLDKTIQLWRLEDGTPAASPLQGHSNYVYSVVFSPDGTLLLSGSEDMSVCVWRVSDGLAVTSPFQGHTSGVTLVAVLPDGTLAVSGSDDCTVQVWRIADGLLAASPFFGQSGRIWSVGYSPDGTQVIAGFYDQTVQMWNVRKGIVPSPSSDHALPKIRSLWFLPNHGYVLTKSDKDEMQMWDVSNGTSQPAPSNMQPPSPPSHVTSPNSSCTAQADLYGRLVKVMRVDDGTVAAGPFEPAPQVWQFTDNSALVIVGSKDGTIQGISLQTGETVYQLRSAGDNYVDLIAQCLDGSLLASVDDNSYSSRTLRVWSTTLPILVFRAAFDAPPTPGSSQTLSEFYNGCYVDEDGWLVNSCNDLLLWLPAEIAHAGLSPFVLVIITEFGRLEIPKQMLVAGREWDKCYIQK
ncbi:hypothetical protein RHS03_07997, partial [Rhizoctonia solani]